jgi:hypothetical protein
MLVVAIARLLNRASGAIAHHCARAWKKFRKTWKASLMIPLVAAFVGWFTNWLAVKMIFLPVSFWGFPPFHQWVVGSLYGIDILQPGGLFGWQGIVPAKAAQMAFNMVEMVTTRLVDVSEVFSRLDPQVIFCQNIFRIFLLSADIRLGPSGDLL